MDAHHIPVIVPSAPTTLNQSKLRSASASLTQAKLHHPDLILMDLSLPDLDGWEAVSHLRKMLEFRTTPIIAVTAHVSPQEAERAMAAGCTTHIGKPFDTRALLKEVARLLTERSSVHGI